MTADPVNEKNTEEAFTRQSLVFDDIYSGNPIIQYKRERVRSHVLEYLLPNSSILELNSGTGEDAVFFARMGHRVHATDISSGMQDILKRKIDEAGLQQLVSTELCSFTHLEELQNKGPYDLVFSNFAGLNCTRNLDVVLGSFDPLLKPGGFVTLVLMPKFCLWETLLFFKGNFKTAFRRFFSGKGKKAHIEGVYFKCWYYNPFYVVKKLKKNFSLLSTEGLCTIVPPSYLESFPVKHPKKFQYLKRKEERYKRKWPWRSIGDYYIITLKKRSSAQ